MLGRGKTLFSIKGVAPFFCFRDLEYRPSHAQIATLGDFTTRSRPTRPARYLACIWTVGSKCYTIVTIV